MVTEIAPFNAAHTIYLLVGHCEYHSALCHFQVVWRWIILWP